MIGRNFKKAGLLYLAAALFDRGIAFLTIPIFTRLLSPADYGVVNTYNSWVNILTVFLSMALYMAIRLSYVDFPNKRHEFLSSIVTFILLLSSIITAFTICLRPFINIKIYYLILWCLFQSFSTSILLCYTHFLMMDLRFIKRTFFLVGPNVLAVILSICSILYIVKEDLYNGRIITTALVFGMFSILILFKIYSQAPPSLNLTFLGYGLKISAPLVFHGIALSMLSQFDRTMITCLASIEQTGVYSLVYNFSMIATVLTRGLDGLWIPWLIKNLNQKKFNQINICAKDYNTFMFVAIGGVILIGPELLKLISHEKYWDGIRILPPLMLSNYIIFAYTLYVNVEHFYKKTVNIAIFTVIAAIMNVILNYVFIPRYGYVAAAGTTLASYMCCFLLHMKNSQRIESEVIPPKIFFGSMLQLSIVIVVFYLTIENWQVRWVAAVVFFLANLCKKRERVVKLIRLNIKNRATETTKL